MIAAIRNIDLTGPVCEDIEERLRTAERILGKDRLVDALWRQYQVCVDNEKFYEEIAWKVGSIFVPVGLGLGTLFLQKGGEPSPVPIVAGFLLFATWVLLLYDDDASELPHWHQIACEYQLMLAGRTTYRDSITGEEVSFSEGDFYFIETGTCYSQRSAPHTRILFIKVPSINDKTACRNCRRECPSRLEPFQEDVDIKTPNK